VTCDRAHPAAQGGTVQRDAVPFQDAFLAVQRQVVGILAGDDLRQQAWPRQSFVERLRQLGGGDDVFLAVPASVLHALVLDDEQRRRHPVELLAGLVADRAAWLAAAGAAALGLRQFVAATFAAQVSRQTAPAVRRGARRCRRR